MHNKNGAIYEGDWKNGLFEGKGIYYYINGDRYEGDFKNDKREGKGIYYYNSGYIYMKGVGKVVLKKEKEQLFY